MTTTVIVILVAAALAGIIFFSRDTSSPEDKRGRYLRDLAEHLESSVRPIEEKENSFRINFQRQGLDFIFEDIEDYEVNQKVFHKGYLRLKLPGNLTVSFTERSRTGFRSGGDSTSAWPGKSTGVDLPKELNDFHIYTNQPDLMNQLLKNPGVINAFVKSKDASTRGRPVMSLEMAGGWIVLQFHDSNLSPRLDEIRYNVSSIDQYADRLLAIQRCFAQIERE